MARGNRKKYKGETYASEFELSVAKRLAKRKDLKVEYEAEAIPYVLFRNYTPDFKIETATQKTLYIEAKGHFDRDSRAKMLAVKDQHPEKEICIVFESDNLLYKGAKWRYSDWAERNGFKYSINEIPKEWFE